MLFRTLVFACLFSKSASASVATLPMPAAIHAMVQSAVQINKTARSYAEWMSSGQTPEEMFDKLAAMKDPQAWRALCVKLRSLSDADLALFDRQIARFETSESLPCRAQLLVRLGTYWGEKRLDLLIARNESGETAGPVVLPSVERMIDPREQSVLFDGGLKEREIALTFDDGPHPQQSKRVLEILEEAGVRATYFDVGKNAKEHADLVREQVRFGHSVGSHSWDHQNLPRLAQRSMEKARKNILYGHDQVMTAAGGIETPFFRFPYGARTKTLQRYVEELGISTFFWNMDSLDWKLRDPMELFSNVLRELDREKGGIILFHDIHEQTVIVLPHVLAELKRRGFTTVVFLPQFTTE